MPFKQAAFAILILLLAVFPLHADDFVIDEPGSSDHKSREPGISRVLPGSIGSVQTPATLARGRITGEFVFYDGGGIHTRLMVGLFDMLSIGVSENLGNVIGGQPLQFNIPGAYLEAGIIQSGNFMLSAGFDSQAYGKKGMIAQTNGLAATIYGFFISAGWEFRLFKGRDMITVGLRYPLFPFEISTASNTSLCFGIQAALTDQLEAGFTLENLVFDMTRLSSSLPTLLLSYVPVPDFKLTVLFQYEFDTGSLNRILGLTWSAHF